MSETKHTDDIVIVVDDADIAAYFGDDDTEAPTAEPKKRGRKKKEAAPPPTPVEERLQEEAQSAGISVPLTAGEEQELALRDQLEGKGFTAEDFRRSGNYLVEAGAGAGKTYIMIQRIVNQLVSGYCEPRDIVAITFTNKSTLEMRDRLDKFLKERRDALREKEQTAPLTGEEQARMTRLEHLIRETGQMQISTIHSFCQTMLESMPFASRLGLDMQVIENDDAYARDFLKRKWWAENQPFEIPRKLGVPPYLLDRFFLECRKNSEAELGCQDVNSPEASRWKTELRDAVNNLQRELHGLTALPGLMQDRLLAVVQRDPKDFAGDEEAGKTLVWLTLNHPEHFPLDWGVKDKEKKDEIWQSVEGLAVDALWLGDWGQKLRDSARSLIHAYTMRDLEALLAEYRAEKIARHIATYDDLLLRTRDMLRESREARAYFHRRYKVIYVDEMQDTDPVQTEMLFYLTTGEEDFDPNNWKNCRPVPGSLFLVGDPKQAIYRFRGADIGVYNDLLSVFRSREDIAKGANAVGEKVTLRFNFRSSTNICDLADRVFRLQAGLQAPHHFVGGKYHAEYVSMNARSGDCPRARTLIYEPSASGPKDDPRRVAAFIYMMIKNKRYVGIHRPDPRDPSKGKHAHPARPEDFLILTRDKSAALDYARELRALGVAAEVTGEKDFKATKPIARAVLHLESLLALRDDQKLLMVLWSCYNLSNEQLRVFLQRTGEHSLTGLTKLRKLEPIQRALEAEASPDQELLAVCAALEEIAVLRKAVRNQPAMAVVEQLLEGGYGVWQKEDLGTREERRQTWSEVQQYLNLVRGSRERSFPALAAYAVACAEKSIEQELGLEPSGKAVQIMNLHKAKGLEGEVVILACDWRKSFPVTRHVERSGGSPREYRCLQAGEFRNKVTIGVPMDWDKKTEEEGRYLEAEYARLMYVAATRAKTMLLVCDKNSKSDKQADKTSYWGPLTGVQLQRADKTDPYYGEAFKVLERISKKDLPQIQPSQAVSVTVDPAALEETLLADARALAAGATYAITPSRLDKHTRGAVIHRDPDTEGEDTSEPQETSGTAPAEEVDEDAIPQVPAEKEAPKAETSTGPYGPAWGTMVHRVMELAILEKLFTDDVLQGAARQAVHEMLVNDELTDRQRTMLGLAADASDEEVIARLTPAVAEAAAFLKDEECRLRKLVDGGNCYPELPFILQARQDDEITGELYRHLSAHIADDKAKDCQLAVEGIIDLAIGREEGWYVVDYKTDKLTRGETPEEYARRLREEYTPQITAYARVLEKMNGGSAQPVKKAWLCSIPLGGRLIELDIGV